jgi:hypothetical protein
MFGRKAGGGEGDGGMGEDGDVVGDEDDDEDEDETEIVAMDDAAPAELVAVNVYVVVAAGATDKVPATARPLPTPWSIWTLVAFVTFHSNVAD